jgi:N-acetylmuramoyl-L-alanine amidase CwlA
MYTYQERFLTKYHRERHSRIKWIVVHYTGTAASALANARAIEKPLAKPRSTHYFVDGGLVMAVVPEARAAWHIGGPDPDKKLDVYNTNAIGVDLCEDKLIYDADHKSVGDRDWYFTEETEATAAALIGGIMRRYAIPLDHVVRHYDVTGKWCPRPFVGDDINQAYGESGNSRWRGFLALVSAYYEGALR